MTSANLFNLVMSKIFLFCKGLMTHEEEGINLKILSVKTRSIGNYHFRLSHNVFLPINERNHLTYT